MGSFNCIFEYNSLKALFGQNMKKLKILKLSPDSRYLQKLALNWSEKKKNFYEQNFDSEATWSSVVDFHSMQISLVIRMRFIIVDD